MEDRDRNDRAGRPGLADALTEAAGGDGGVSLRRALTTAVASARDAGLRAVASGTWLAEAVVDAAPRIPVRSPEALGARYGTTDPARLAKAVITGAARSTAALGAAAGSLAAVGELPPVAWISLPLELMVETALVAVVEIRMIAELDGILGHPLPESGRAGALLRSWAEQRGITLTTLAGPGLAEAFGSGARRQLVKAVRRRLLRRMGRGAWALAPLMVGAAAGAALNRRETVRLGRAVTADLGPDRSSTGSSRS